MEIGKNYMVESVVGKIYVGKVVSVEGPHTVLLEGAAWIAQTGRLHVFLRDGKADGMEIEVVRSKCIHWAEWSQWNHKLFTESV